jgi:serine/threonine protein kinase
VIESRARDKDRRYVVVLEYINGTSPHQTDVGSAGQLKDYFRQLLQVPSSFPPNPSLAWSLMCLRGVHAPQVLCRVEEQHLVHHDVKPSNVMVTTEDKVLRGGSMALRPHSR